MDESEANIKFDEIAKNGAKAISLSKDHFSNYGWLDSHKSLRFYP